MVVVSGAKSLIRFFFLLPAFLFRRPTPTGHDELVIARSLRESAASNFVRSM